LRLRFGVLEVISTIMMNFLALDLVSWLVRGPLQEPTHVYPQSQSIDVDAHLPALTSGSRLHWGFPLALILAAGIAYVLRYMASGFRLRIVGANREAAWMAGRIDVGRVTAAAFLVSGALAGTAGAIEVSGVTFALYEDLSPGFGYTAIAVALLAGLNPLWIVPSAILFGALEAGGAAMQRDAGVPSGFVSVVEALIMLSLLAGRVVLPPASRMLSGPPASLPEVLT
jgi:simple sugar transport system permease protein